MLNRMTRFADQRRRWRDLVNMSASDIERYIDTPDGKRAGTPVGQRSARALIGMLRKPAEAWTPTEREWMGRQISFISRMRRVRGPLRDAQGRPTRKLLALKLWGHDPEQA